MKLYRYISYEDFTRILFFNKDKFSRISLWDDKSEGYFFKYISPNDALLRVVLDELYKFTEGDYVGIISWYGRLVLAKCFTYAQCWTKEFESELMWRANNFGNRAIQIETTKEIIVDNLSDISRKEFAIMDGDIRYNLELNESFLKNLMFKDDGRFHELNPYFYKKKEYEHEAEYRFLIEDRRYWPLEQLFETPAILYHQKDFNTISNHDEQIMFIIKNIRKYIWEWTEHMLDSVIMVTIPQKINSYITNVTVAPNAPEWYVSFIDEICQKYDLNFSGKSKVYDYK